MKKFFILCLMTFVVCVNVNGQQRFEDGIYRNSPNPKDVVWDWFNKDNLFTFTCSFGMGAYSNVDYSNIGFDLSLSCMGFYFDIGEKSPYKRNSVDVGVWETTRCEHFHFGYMIPISKHFTITPILGNVISASGVTNGYDWYLTDNGIVNKFYANDEHSYFDYGAILSVYSFCWDKLGIVANIKATKCMVGFSLGIAYNFKK